ncbi:MAG: ABC transporter ATP-binding protein [Lachnospiraceae bacterium]|nr:ABC transporter ATP-binding protein [Lachnospiraceae bacterium]
MKDTRIVKGVKLVKQYGATRALNAVDIDVKAGEIYGLVGNNGAGKTTFLKILTGQTMADAGEVSLFGYTGESEKNRARKRIGALIESPGFYHKMTAEQNLEYYRIQRGIPGKDMVPRALEEVGLLEQRKKKFDKLSFGMKQRLGLALALMGDPELLVLDEPINGLDPAGIIEIRNLLLRLNQEKNITIVISSHVLAELEHIATCYGFLHHGRLLEQISAEDLKAKCRSYLEVQVSDRERYTALLESKLHCRDYRVMPDGAIQILDESIFAEDCGRLAAQHEIAITSLAEKKIELENYYMRLVEEAN